MYSGMRLNEICQLYVSDLIELDGLVCFDVNDEADKRLKNKSSRRVVPVHPELLKLGLMEYVKKMKGSANPRLWMNLSYGRDGYGQHFSRWFQRYNRKYITQDPKKVFHSLRHTVADTLKQAGVETSVISELLGHSHDKGNMTLSRYGKRYRPKVLLDALMKLDYGFEK
jgi:integrase